MGNSYAIFGLGSFGSKLAVSLSDLGNTVLGCDIDPVRVDALRDKVTESIIADVSNHEVVKELSVGKFDVIILGMSSHFEGQILALTHLKQEGAKKIIANFPVKRSAAEWGLRWLWDQKEVTVVLSGMNSDEMVAENLATASTAHVGELTDADQAMLQEVVAAIQDSMKVGCTACGYCQPCPKNVDIPGTFACYNRAFTEGRKAAVKEYLKCTAFRKDSTAASNCVGCGKCEKHCPQGIEIRKELAEASKCLETPIYRIIRKGIELIKAF